MRTALSQSMKIEFPIFAFTHCRDVVVAVSKAGGFGVLGAVGFTPGAARDRAQLDRRAHRRPPLRRRHRDPQQVRGHGLADMSADELKKTLQRHGAGGASRLRPQAPRRPRRPARPTSDDDALQLLGWTEATATPQVEVALQHPKVTLIANALGTPPRGDDQAHPRRGPQGRGAVRIAVPGPQARRRRRRHHHRPGRRGRRALRRGRLDRAVAAGRQGGRARCPCWPPVASAAGSRSPRRWRSARRAHGPARSG